MVEDPREKSRQLAQDEGEEVTTVDDSTAYLMEVVEARSRAREDGPNDKQQQPENSDTKEVLNILEEIKEKEIKLRSDERTTTDNEVFDILEEIKEKELKRRGDNKNNNKGELVKAMGRKAGSQEKLAEKELSHNQVGARPLCQAPLELKQKLMQNGPNIAPYLDESDPSNSAEFQSLQRHQKTIQNNDTNVMRYLDPPSTDFPATGTSGEHLPPALAEGLARNRNNNNIPFHQEPGAYPLGNGAMNCENSVVIGEEGGGSEAMIAAGGNYHHNNVSGRGAQGLVEANPVTEEVVDLEDAQPFEPRDEGRRNRKHNNRIFWVGVAAIVIMVAIIIVVLAVFATRSDGNNQGTAGIVWAPGTNQTDVIVVPSPSPTETPTTNAPTVDPLLEIIPEYSRKFILSDVSSSQSKAFLWLSNYPNVTALPEWHKLQLYALACFYHDNDGTNWPLGLDKDWLDSSRSECSWYSGIYGRFDTGQESLPFVHELYRSNYNVCNERGGFEGLDLRGGAPHVQQKCHMSEELALLTGLKYFHMSGHNFAEGISFLDVFPPVVPSLEEMIIWDHDITGFLPTEVGLFPNLISLSLRRNNLSGTLPSQLGKLTAMKRIHIEQTRMTGPIPFELTRLKNMLDMRLEDSQLTGSIHTEFGTMEELVQLRFRKNRLTGRIPTQFGHLRKVEILGLYNNQLSGSLPRELGQITEMRHFCFTKNNFSGTIPMEWGALNHTTVFMVGDNRLVGSIPVSLGAWSHLIAFTVNNNQLTGHVLDVMAGSQWKDVIRVELPCNQFSGTIPPSIGELNKQLGYLRIENNKFTGRVPSQIGLLTHLVDLRLSNNRFSGDLPSEIGLLTNLQTLWIHDTNFVSLPSEIGLLTKLTDLGTGSGHSNDTNCAPADDDFTHSRLLCYY